MSFNFGFFNAEMQGGAYDREYNAEQFAEYFHLLVGNGVFADPATSLQVVASSPASMMVEVRPGYGWINGYWAKVDGENYKLNVGPASGNQSRIDTVVLRWVNANRAIELAVKQGTYEGGIPELQRDHEVWELGLANITVGQGITSITDSIIADTRTNSERCGIVATLIDQIDTTDLFLQYEDAFIQWFENIQSQMEGDVATNLQRQIEQKVSLSDKATAEDIKNGTDGKWVDAKSLKESGGLAKPGDIVYSADDLSISGKFLPCRQQVITKAGNEDIFENLSDYSKMRIGSPTQRPFFNNSSEILGAISYYHGLEVNGSIIMMDYTNSTSNSNIHVIKSNGDCVFVMSASNVYPSFFECNGHFAMAYVQNKTLYVYEIGLDGVTIGQSKTITGVSAPQETLYLYMKQIEGTIFYIYEKNNSQFYKDGLSYNGGLNISTDGAYSKIGVNGVIVKEGDTFYTVFGDGATNEKLYLLSSTDGVNFNKVFSLNASDSKDGVGTTYNKYVGLWLIYKGDFYIFRYESPTNSSSDAKYYFCKLDIKTGALISKLDLESSNSAIATGYTRTFFAADKGFIVNGWSEKTGKSTIIDVVNMEVSYINYSIESGRGSFRDIGDGKIAFYAQGTLPIFYRKEMSDYSIVLNNTTLNLNASPVVAIADLKNRYLMFLPIPNNPTKAFFLISPHDINSHKLYGFGANQLFMIDLDTYTLPYDLNAYFCIE